MIHLPPAKTYTQQTTMHIMIMVAVPSGVKPFPQLGHKSLPTPHRLVFDDLIRHMMRCDYRPCNHLPVTVMRNRNGRADACCAQH